MSWTRRRCPWSTRPHPRRAEAARRRRVEWPPRISRQSSRLERATPADRRERSCCTPSRPSHLPSPSIVGCRCARRRRLEAHLHGLATARLTVPGPAALPGRGGGCTSRRAAEVSLKALLELRRPFEVLFSARSGGAAGSPATTPWQTTWSNLVRPRLLHRAQWPSARPRELRRPDFGRAATSRR